jgi:hypothetical protein
MVPGAAGGGVAMVPGPMLGGAPAPIALGGLGVMGGNVGGAGIGGLVGPAPGGGAAGLAAALAALAAQAPARQQAVVDDARTLPIHFGDDSHRHRDFREAITLCQKSEFDDWPIKGPRTTPWLTRMLSEGSSTPLNHHAKFIAFFKLSPGDPVALQHEAWCKVLQTMVCYDQLDVHNLASAELVCRQLQLLEDRHSMVSDKGEAAAASEESSLYMGTSTAHGAVLVAPELKSWIAGELAREASILKERRKAREERTLSRNNQGGKK